MAPKLVGYYIYVSGKVKMFCAGCTCRRIRFIGSPLHDIDFWSIKDGGQPVCVRCMKRIEGLHIVED